MIILVALIINNCISMTHNNFIPLYLEKFIPYRLSVLANLVSQSLASLYVMQLGISPAEWRVMAVLATSDLYSVHSANGICARNNMDKVQVSRAIAKLIKSNLILRQAGKIDLRKTSLKLSAKGQQVYSKIVPLVLNKEKELLSVLNQQEKKQLDTLLTKLHTHAKNI